MAKVPVICNSCKAFFVTESIVGGNATNITFENCTFGPCPHCGGDGHILDGTYEFIGNTIKILSAPQNTIFELQRLAKILQDARDRNATAQEIKDQVTQELPKLSTISNLLPHTRAELYAFISMILAVIGLVIVLLNRKESPNIQVDQVINNIQQNIQISPEMKESPRPPDTDFVNQHQESKKIGRNDPCPCGSGKKYKHCCGK